MVANFAASIEIETLYVSNVLYSSLHRLRAVYGLVIYAAVGLLQGLRNQAE